MSRAIYIACGFAVVVCSDGVAAGRGQTSGPAAEATEFEPAKAVDEEVARFLGTYHYAGGAAQRHALEKAIEKVCDEVNILFREIVRRRLTHSNPIPKAIAISGTASDLTISFDERAYTAPINGPAVRVVGIEGNPLQLRHRLRNGNIVQTFLGERGTKINVFSINESGRLRLRVTVAANQLPKDLEYRLTFARPK